MLPTKEEAERLLKEAEGLNPGPWGDHSRICAYCAEKIAECFPGLNPKKAFILGLLHDIGRRFGVKHLCHVTDGYHYMMDLGYDEAARVCMTHSFNNGKIEEYIGKFDTVKEDTDLIIAYLAEINFDDYDRLIQLCDALAGSSAILDVEARMNDVKSRYGYYPEDKWNRNLALLAYFSEGCGMDVYKVVCKDSFRLPY